MKNGKIFGKINLVDFLVVLVLVLFAAGVGIRLTSSAPTQKNSGANYEITLSVKGVRKYTADALEKMGKLTDNNGNDIIGEIVSVETTPYELQVGNAKGELNITTMPERYTCTVKIRTESGFEKDDRRFISDGIELAVGRGMDIVTRELKTTGAITEVTQID